MVIALNNKKAGELAMQRTTRELQTMTGGIKLTPTSTCLTEALLAQSHGIIFKAV